MGSNPDLSVVQGGEGLGEPLNLLESFLLDLLLHEFPEGVVSVSDDEGQKEALSDVDSREEHHQVGQLAEHLLGEHAVEGVVREHQEEPVIRRVEGGLKFLDPIFVYGILILFLLRSQQ